MTTQPQRPIRVAANAVILRDDHVLLVEFDDETGPHYNFPGGGVEPGETLEEAVVREVREETCLDVEVERLLLIVESVASRYTNTIRGVRVPWNQLRFFFLCRPTSASEARLPDLPDENQTGVAWIPLNTLPNIALLPQVSRELVAALAAPPLPIIIPRPDGHMDESITTPLA